MENSQKIAQFSVPGSSGSQPLNAPEGVPQALRGGLESSGNAFFQTVVNNLIILGSFLALVMVMISGIQWIMSRGDPQKVASAKRRLFFAIIGLLIMLGAFFIVRVIIFITGGDYNQFMNPSQMLNSSS